MDETCIITNSKYSIAEKYKLYEETILPLIISVFYIVTQ